jgi:hypothetical protein
MFQAWDKGNLVGSVRESVKRGLDLEEEEQPLFEPLQGNV